MKEKIERKMKKKNNKETKDKKRKERNKKVPGEVCQLLCPGNSKVGNRTFPK